MRWKSAIEDCRSTDTDNNEPIGNSSRVCSVVKATRVPTLIADVADGRLTATGPAA